MKRISNTSPKKYNSIQSNFAISMYQAAVVGSSANNVVISPMAIRSCLSLAYFGTEGSTESELQKYLYLPHSKQHVAEKIQNMHDRSKRRKIFVTGNTISIPKSVEVKEDFVDLVKTATNEPPLRQDFTKPSAAIAQINHIMSALTNGKFKDIINSETLENPNVILLSAIYLKATFGKPFPFGNTEKNKFWVNGNTAVEVQMMQTTDNFRFCELPSIKAKVVALPFTIENNFMLLILPDSRTGVSEIEHNLKDIELFELASEMVEKEIDIKMPKFSVDFRMNAMSTIPKIGIKEIFSPSANFKGISENKINVSHVFHSAQVCLTETGAEGGTTTDYVHHCNFTEKVEQIKFYVDRPFIFVIKDELRVHFIGRIVKV